ncbi:hypothetical protein ACOMHN_012944 [Nucella lapillus]
MVKSSTEVGQAKVLTTRLELIEDIIAFRPPPDQNSSIVSMQELSSSLVGCRLCHKGLTPGKNAGTQVYALDVATTLIDSDVKF